MIYLLAFLLGLVQGVAEFLPISSSGHLALAAQWLRDTFGAQSESLQDAAFNIAVHVGTLGSIVIVYWQRLLKAATNVRLIALVVLATLPVVLTGLLFKSRVESLMESPRNVGFALLATAAFLACIGPLERWHQRRRDAAGTAAPEQPVEVEDAVPALTVSETPADEQGRTLDTMTWRDALIVGALQSIAIIPGISRSGSTIFAGVLAGMNRRDAADFSFFIAIPAIAGAAVLELKDTIEAGRLEVAADVLCWGAVVALVTGLVSLKFLLALIAKGQLIWFSAYCSLVGVAALIAFA